MPKIIFNHKAIMANAHRYWAMQKKHGWLGPRATFADAMRRAWRAARQEVSQIRNGYNIGLTEYVSIVEAAPVAIELRRAA